MGGYDEHAVDPFASRIHKRGFGSMDPARVKALAAAGGRAAHAKGLAHEFTSDEAREAGRKGGKARVANLRAKKTQAA